MKFECQPVDTAFLEEAPLRFVNEAELPMAAERVFAILEDGEAWPRWFKDIRKVTWTTPKPFGVGTTRTVRLATLTVFEYFFIWEQGHRFSFYFTGHTLPMARAFAEDYQLHSLGPDRCRFLYTVACRPQPWMIPFQPIMRLQLGSMFRKATAGLVAYTTDLAKG
ncbi:SRPBCC family protein [Sulfidibacter corallicola]|uniref:SRPBCC family protein n=1 Tax=Sulfidibacter corallicola TaxID=2818388 RepID=A0A8A4TKK0_SULCO|nr:SRPBCC family protein [Sulfidibacter corallicola]QTD50476.1 SRPBCC family protein [Sulfidibacter corallicola]